MEGPAASPTQAEEKIEASRPFSIAHCASRSRPNGQSARIALWRPGENQVQPPTAVTPMWLRSAAALEQTLIDHELLPRQGLHGLIPRNLCDIICGLIKIIGICVCICFRILMWFPLIFLAVIALTVAMVGSSLLHLSIVRAKNGANSGGLIVLSLLLILSGSTITILVLNYLIFRHVRVIWRGVTNYLENPAELQAQIAYRGTGRSQIARRCTRLSHTTTMHATDNVGIDMRFLSRFSYDSIHSRRAAQIQSLAKIALRRKDLPTPQDAIDAIWIIYNEDPSTQNNARSQRLKEMLNVHAAWSKDIQLIWAYLDTLIDQSTRLTLQQDFVHYVANSAGCSHGREAFLWLFFDGRETSISPGEINLSGVRAFSSVPEDIQIDLFAEMNRFLAQLGEEDAEALRHIYVISALQQRGGDLESGEVSARPLRSRYGSVSARVFEQIVLAHRRASELPFNNEIT